ncbi:flavin reductase family protein [Pseudomonas sp. PCH199]|uniref:flavin reductase family protein n=1 Tax=unclassified Pseudomonas TaxID=196821 RepID=UPI000BCF71F2|nr:MULTISPECIES: flavin reductase family protein [unclassified Pseudomonas]MCW8278788.1 flavin reductase family protein [Pseudomonas sp. PCH199]PAM81003.1 flavin reductase [Pseudomonas sp. ERMR1:02]
MFLAVGRDDEEINLHWMSCVVPRPVGWVSTVSASGIPNLAPYSFFNALSENPPIVAFGSNGRHAHGRKDTAKNILETGQFVCNMTTFDLHAQVRTTSEGGRPDINKFERAGLDFEASSLVKPPRVKASPIHIECVLWKTVELPSELEENLLIIGRVVGVHINDACLTEGRIDLSRIRPLARLGYGQFSTLGDIVKGGA